jgi:hypothetical protein
MGRKKNSVGHQLKYYCYMLNVADEAGIKPCGYQLQKALGLLPVQLNSSKGQRNNKWDRYFYFKDKTPSSASINEIQKRFKKSNYILKLPLWMIFALPTFSQESIYDMFLKMPVNIKRHLFQLHSPYELKQEIPSRALEAIERIGTEHALACFMGLFMLEVNKTIDLCIYDNIERTLKRCCLEPPLDKIKAELFDEIIKFINTPYDIPEDYIILESRERFLYKVESLNISFNAFKKMHITEKTKNERELTYWLMKGNDSEIIKDFHRIKNRQPLTRESEGVLWVLEHMLYQSKGLMKVRLKFLHVFFLKGDYSKSNLHCPYSD